MFKKHSIFIKILVPVILVMLFQTLIISLVLFVNGTIDSLDDGAIDSMRKNVENRGITLEDMMVHYWSNLDRLEMDAAAGIDAYLKETGLSVRDALGKYEHETKMLLNLSDALLGALRRTSSTGAFMYFLGEYEEAPVTLNGLYYRDLDPVLTPADYSDILFLRGFIDIARKDKIQLDSLWYEFFSFSPDSPAAWESYAQPQRAAAMYPKASPADLSYWSEPRLIFPNSSQDANRCITYTRPVFYEGKPVAMIGTEVQVSHLEKYFPANDFDHSGKSGYMLVKYRGGDAPRAGIDLTVYAITGSYVKRIIAPGDHITLSGTDRSGVYTVSESESEGVKIVLNPLRLYNTNTPFIGDQWALASVGTDSVLFESSRNVGRGILLSSAFALVAGSILLALIIRMTTRPLISIAGQIEKSDLYDPVVVSDSNTNEIVLLCSTINAMREKRGQVEAQLREERERYLVALESAADTFMEYDIAQDSFMLYYFSGDNSSPEICSRVTDQFMDRVRAGEICHPDDISGLAAFLSAKDAQPIEVRAKTSLFSHIASAETDGEYYWFLFKASRILDGDGNVVKIVGTAKEMTREKLEEFSRIESARRDPTTGLYNREYGLQLIKSRAIAAWKTGTAFALAFVHADDFERFEAYYGRVFGGVILRDLSRSLLNAMALEDVAARLTNDEFLVLLDGAGEDKALGKMARFSEGIARQYTGENADLRLSASVGIALSADADRFDELFSAACQSARYAMKNGGGHTVVYSALPPEAKKESIACREKPVGVFLDISRENVVGFAFELFERTQDVRSAVNILLSVLGGMFSLRQIVVCEYDADFGASQVTCQWNEAEAFAYHGSIEKLSYRDLADFEAMLDENGALIYDNETVLRSAEGVKKLLCARPGEDINAYLCVMYVNGIHMGRILFKSRDRAREWTEAERLSLYEITKIIAAHLSVEKSNSASRAKSEFLSRISHEIRTPMNAIIGMTGIAKNSMNDPERLDDCLGKIDFSAKHLLSLINDVLEMSRIESGKLTIESAPFSLSEFIAGIETLMRPPIEDRGIALVIESKVRHDAVVGDEYRLRQVLVNLLGNANKFTEPGGRVVFSVEELEGDAFEHETGKDRNAGEAAGYFRFSVKDNGAGISQEDQPRVFKAFEQATSSSRRQGTGLGLAISGNIVSAMGGKIELNSKLSEGSEFYFTLALKLNADAASATLPEQGEADYGGYFKGKRALLVEDNEINIEIASYVLDDAGFEIDVARNGKEAVDMFFASARGHYDVVLMDIQMPVMDGLTATRNIRKNADREDARAVPIIAMTANAFDEDMKKSIESGMNGHIAKPIDNQKLYALLKQLIKNGEALT